MILAILIAVIVVSLVGYLFFWLPFQAVQANIDQLTQDLETKKRQIATFNKDKKKLERWPMLSLPGEVTIPVKAGSGVFQDKENQYFDLEGGSKKYLKICWSSTRSKATTPVAARMN